MSVMPPWDRPSTRDLGAERLGPYVLIEDVTASELNTIHLARPHDAPSHAEPLIIKRLRREFARDPDRRAALQREATLLSQLRSPYVVRAQMVDGLSEPCVVMERVEGASLATLLACSDPRSIETTRMVLPLMADVLWGLDDLHRAQPLNGGSFLVHQAPCARHVMVGLSGRARIIDLTLAMGPEHPRSPLADHRLRPEEMAPEQALAPAQVDARCDVFIVGVTLWEALTGRRLFAEASPEASLQRMLRSTIVSPGEAGAAARRVFDPVCMRALSRARGQRFPSAGEMASELCDHASKAGLFAERDEVAAWAARLLARPSQAITRNPKLQNTMQGIGGLDALFDESTPKPRSKRRADASRTLAGVTALPSLPAPSELPVPPAKARDEASSIVPSDMHGVDLEDTSAPRRSRVSRSRRKLNLTLVCLAALSVTGVAAFVSRTPSARSSAIESIPPSLRKVLPSAVLGASAPAAQPFPSARAPSALPAGSADAKLREEQRTAALSAQGETLAPGPAAGTARDLAPPPPSHPITNEVRESQDRAQPAPPAEPTERAPRTDRAASPSGKARAKPARVAAPASASAAAPIATSDPPAAREWSPGPPIGSGTSAFASPGGTRKMSAPASSAAPSALPAAIPASPVAAPEDLPVNPY